MSLEGIGEYSRDCLGDIYYWSLEFKSYQNLAAEPEGMQVIPLLEQVEKPHLEHQNPFNCCSQWAVWGEEGSSIAPRQLPDEVLAELRFGYPKSKEKPLKFTANGSVLSSSLAATRRMSEETFAIFENMF